MSDRGNYRCIFYHFSQSKNRQSSPFTKIIFIPVEIPAFFYLFWWLVQQIFYGIGQLEFGGTINEFSLADWTHGVGLIIGCGLIPLMVKEKPSTAIY